MPVINWRAMLIGCAEILDGLARVLSLGHLHLNTSWRVAYRLEVSRLMPAPNHTRPDNG